MTRAAAFCALFGFILLPLAADIDADLRGAVERRDAARVRELLRGGANVDAADSSGRTPLMLAARAGSSDMVRLLLASKAAPDAVDTAGWTALMYGAAYGGRAVVDDLLAAGADPRLREKLGKTAEELATQRDQSAAAVALRQRREAEDERVVERLRGSIDAVPPGELERLIAEGTPDLRGRVLDAALAQGRTDVVRRVLQRGGGLDLDSPRRIGSATAPPVGWYALEGDAETLRLLLEAGASPAASYQGKSALVLAAQGGREAAAAALMDGGAAPSAEALAAAARARQPGTASLLARRGAPLDARALGAAVDADNGEFIQRLAAGRIAAGQTGDALERAIAGAHLQAARALVRDGLTTRAERTAAFVRAVAAGYLGLARLVREAGIDAPALDRAMIAAASSANSDAVRELLAEGASANARDAASREQPTALMLAARLLDVETVGVLVDAGADVGAVDAAGNDVRWYVQQGNSDGRNQRDALKITNRLQAAVDR